MSSGGVGGVLYIEDGGASLAGVSITLNRCCQRAGLACTDPPIIALPDSA